MNGLVVAKPPSNPMSRSLLESRAFSLNQVDPHILPLKMADFSSLYCCSHFSLSEISNRDATIFVQLATISLDFMSVVMSLYSKRTTRLVQRVLHTRNSSKLKQKLFNCIHFNRRFTFLETDFLLFAV